MVAHLTLTWIRLNYEAGLKAKSAASYEGAHKLVKKGIELLGEEGWKENYHLCYQLHQLCFVCSYLSEDFV